MKICLIIAVTIFFLISCHSTNEELQQRIGNADSVAINYFRGDGSMDTVIAVKIVRDKENIDRLTSFVSARSIKPDYKCGADGSLHFFKINKVIQDIDFSIYSADCTQFTFLQHGQLKGSKLSNEAKKLLEDLKNK
jgi:hypothetical protein